MQFKHAYDGWTQKRLTQEEAALLLNVCPRTFWRYINRFEEDGMDGLIPRRKSTAMVQAADTVRHLRLNQRRLKADKPCQENIMSVTRLSGHSKPL